MEAFSIEALDLEEVRAVYPAFLVPAFPINELKPLKRIEAAIRRGEYQCYGARMGDAIAGVAFFVKIRREGRTLMLFDYFVVSEALRCRGIGSRFLRALIEGPLRHGDVALLEVDEPTCAASPGERDVRNRRLDFYLRNGLIDTGVLVTVYDVTYRILCLPVGEVPAPDEVRRIYTELYHAILPPRLYRKWVLIEDDDAP